MSLSLLAGRTVAYCYTSVYGGWFVPFCFFVCVYVANQDLAQAIEEPEHEHFAILSWAQMCLRIHTVCILHFISMIDTTSGNLKAREAFTL